MTTLSVVVFSDHEPATSTTPHDKVNDRHQASWHVFWQDARNPSRPWASPRGHETDANDAETIDASVRQLAFLPLRKRRHRADDTYDCRPHLIRAENDTLNGYPVARFASDKTQRAIHLVPALMLIRVRRNP